VIIRTTQALKFHTRDGARPIELKVGVDNHIEHSQLHPYMRTKLARLRAANVVFGYEDAEPRFNPVNPRGRETLEDVGGGQ
jgi:hypothetical protein